MVTRFRDKDYAFLFARKICIIVDGYQVAEFVKCRFLRVAESVGKNLELGPVRLNPDGCSLG